MAGNTLNVEIKGLNELVKRYHRAPEIVEPVLQQAIVKSAATLVENTVPPKVPWITGTLARSFDPPYIRPLLARWFPRVLYARRVQYEGKSKGYMERIKSNSVDKINEIFRNSLDVIVKKMKKF